MIHWTKEEFNNLWNFYVEEPDSQNFLWKIRKIFLTFSCILETIIHTKTLLALKSKNFKSYKSYKKIDEFAIRSFVNCVRDS